MLPHLKILETERQKLFKKHLLLWVIVSIAIIIFFATRKEYDVFNLLFSTTQILVFPLVFLGVYYHIDTANFKTKLKNYNLLPTLLKIFNDDIEYGQNIISESDIRRSSLINADQKILRGNELNDEFKGTFDGIPFEVSEVFVATGNGKHRTLNQALFVKYKSNKNIKNKTILRSTKTWWQKIIAMIFLSLFGMPFAYSTIRLTYNLFVNTKTIKDAILYIIFIIISAPIAYFIGSIIVSEIKSTIDKTKLESDNFNKYFETEFEDEVEGRYLITTAFMERILNLQKAFKNAEIECTFFDDLLIFRINTKDMFEFGNLSHRIDSDKNMKRLFNEIFSILAIASYFKLGERTGL